MPQTLLRGRCISDFLLQHLESRRRRPTRRASVAGPGDSVLKRGSLSLAAVPETVEIIDVDVQVCLCSPLFVTFVRMRVFQESIHPFKPAAFQVSNGHNGPAALSLQLPPLPTSSYLPPPQPTLQQSAHDISQIIAESAGSKKVRRGKTVPSDELIMLETGNQRFPSSRPLGWQGQTQHYSWNLTE
jgi:hypothetical protein